MSYRLFTALIWFLQARMNICILPYQCRGNHKIQVCGMLQDSTGHPHLQFLIVKESSTASNQNPEAGKAWQQTYS